MDILSEGISLTLQPAEPQAATVYAVQWNTGLTITSCQEPLKDANADEEALKSASETESAGPGMARGRVPGRG
jgi:hypothetical protein